MKRQKLYFSPNRRQESSNSYELTLNIIVNICWVWCLNLDHMLKRQRSRLGLESLTDEQLSDIGLTREDSRTELNKHFWQD